MKIYKPTFEDLLNEATSPIYIQEFSEKKQEAQVYYLAVTAFNQAGKVLDYTVRIGSVFPGDRNDPEMDRIDEITDHMKKLMNARGVKFLPGIIHNERMTGNPYKTDTDLRKELDIQKAANEVDGEPYQIDNVSQES